MIFFMTCASFLFRFVVQILFRGPPRRRYLPGDQMGSGFVEALQMPDFGALARPLERAATSDAGSVASSLVGAGSRRTLSPLVSH